MILVNRYKIVVVKEYLNIFDIDRTNRLKQ